MKISEFSFLSNSILDLKYKETEFSWIQVNSIEFSFKIKRVIFSPCLFCCQQCLWLISLIQSRFKNYCCLGKIFCSNGKRYKKFWVMGIEYLRIFWKIVPKALRILFCLVYSKKYYLRIRECLEFFRPLFPI